MAGAPCTPCRFPSPCPLCPPSSFSFASSRRCDVAGWQHLVGVLAVSFHIVAVSPHLMGGGRGAGKWRMAGDSRGWRGTLVVVVLMRVIENDGCGPTCEKIT